MFYTFDQNNSGGRFTFNEKAGISHYVIIEADSNKDADNRAEDIGLYFNGCDDGRDCDCCGDRWHRSYCEGDEQPTVFGQPIKDGLLPREKWIGKWIKGPEGFIHYKDGRVEPFDYAPKE